MSIESVMRAAEAAGFATASDENDAVRYVVAAEGAIAQKPVNPKDVLSFGMPGALSQPFGGLFARSNFAYFLPARQIKA